MSFARHQTFYLRAGWLAKALDELTNAEKPFSGEDAPVRLGIGKNMVQSLRFWVQACWIAEAKSKRLTLTRFGEMVKRYDPYLEMDLTWWTIHYHLATRPEDATAWYYLFNVFPQSEFTRLSFVEGLLEYAGSAPSESSYRKDYDCIVASYGEGDKAQSPEENTECPLGKLGLLRQLRRQVMRKSNPEQDVPLEVLYMAVRHALPDDATTTALNVADLLKPLGIGPVFNLTMDSVYRYLDQLQERGWLRFSRTAGLDSIVLEDLGSWELIESAYLAASDREVSRLEA